MAKEALERAGITGDKLDEVMFGCILTAGLGQNVARQVAIGAGIPHEVPAYTVGMVCGSGMKSVIEAARAIMSGTPTSFSPAVRRTCPPPTPCALPLGRRMGGTSMVDTWFTTA